VNYQEFLESKSQLGNMSGFKPLYIPDCLFDFQKSLTDWAIRKGKSGIFADCGLGKTPMQLVWAENVVRQTNKPVLILAPLAVGMQTTREGDKFGIEVKRSLDGHATKNITITNYERLHYFNPSDFGGVVCDESSILKNFDGAFKAQVTEFMRLVPYRLLCTATAAPNDYIELGTSSEAIGELGYTDMLSRFFINDQKTIKPVIYRHRGQNFQKISDEHGWRFKGHAETAFWRWVCSWARAVRKPSDLGFDNGKFTLPELIERETIVKAKLPRANMLFDVTAVGLQEEREVKRRTINERCEAAAQLVNHNKPAVLWCHLNDEGDTLKSLIPDSKQISGSDSDEVKEERFEAFRTGQLRVLVIKPKIGAFGLNWQHCAHVVYFASHSYEQYYQAVRRCWRFGQTQSVVVDMVRTDSEERVVENLKRKTLAADRMFADLVKFMNESLRVDRSSYKENKVEVPKWL
jgi:hypothetical protein